MGNRNPNKEEVIQLISNNVGGGLYCNLHWGQKEELPFPSDPNEIYSTVSLILKYNSDFPNFHIESSAVGHHASGFTRYVLSCSYAEQ